jgi:hypothetical protein
LQSAGASGKSRPADARAQQRLLKASAFRIEPDPLENSLLKKFHRWNCVKLPSNRFYIESSCDI